jgi:RHS repeat-associated protein
VKYDYTFTTGLLRSILYQVEGVDVRRVRYEYTSGGNLAKVIVEDPDGAGWEEIETTYYGYHDNGAGQLQYVLGDDAFKRWEEAGPSASAALFADSEFDYNEDGTVSSSKSDGGSCESDYDYCFEPEDDSSSSSSGGAGESSSSSSGGASGLSCAVNTITETRNDGSQVIYLTNKIGELVARTVKKGSSTWHSVYQEFDSKGRVVLQAKNSAISSVGLDCAVTLKDDEGLIRTYEYDGTSGLRKAAYLQRGDGAHDKTKLWARTFTERKPGDVAIYKLHQETHYRGASATGSDPVTTTHTYTWYQDASSNETFQVEKKTVTLPAVPSSQNGSGVEDTRESHFDTWGFLTKEVNERGVATTYQYDVLRGAMTQMVRNDVGVDPDPLPDDTNLVTDYEIDDLGRTIKQLGPVHTIDLEDTLTKIRSGVWTHYRDAEEEVITIQGYQVVGEDGSSSSSSGGGDENAHTVNPVRINRSYEDDPTVSGTSMRSQIAAEYTGEGIPPEDHVYLRSSWLRWSSQHFNEGGMETYSREYHQIPSTGQGTEGPDFGQTELGYDELCRNDEENSPEDTTAKQSLNAMGWLEQNEVGTNTSPSNLVAVEERTYANAAGKDGYPSLISRAVDGDSDNNRKIAFSYDFRNRVEKTTVNDGTRDYITVQEYDNLDRVTKVSQYHTSYDAQDPDNKLISRQESAYDNRGRVYETKQYADTGSASTAQVSKSWFDAAGNLIRQENAGSEVFTVTDYNDLNRAVTTYVGYEPDSSSSSSSSSGSGAYDPADVSEAIIMEQGETIYDRGGNTIESIRRARFDDATELGPLGTPSSTTAPKARVSYAGNYPDGVGRAQADVNVGTDGGGTGWSRPTTIPASDADTLVTAYEYDAAGDLEATTDPAGRVDKRSYDSAGRLTQTIENYQESGSSSSSSSSGGPDCVGANRITNYEYNLDNSLVKLIAQNAATGNQETEWIYGVDNVTKGSLINSNALLWKKVVPSGGCPDESSSSSSSSGGSAGTSTYKYNRQGQATEFEDAAGTTHSYSYDKLGRMTSDVASNLPAALDDTITEIHRSYDNHLRLETVASKGLDAGVIKTKNEVAFEYNGFGQLTEDKQEHDGAVDVGSASRKVQYEYAPGTANTIRRTGMTYPSSETTTIKYNSEAANKLSRPDTLALGSTDEASYRYLGLGMFVGVDYLGIDSNDPVFMTYEDGGTGSAGDKYSGLDAFGRVLETLWKKGSDVKQNVSYGYDQSSNRNWRRNKLAHTLSNGEQEKHDSFYRYDGLGQIIEWQQGNLTGTTGNPYTGIGNKQREEDWCHDGTGNWQNYDYDGPESPSEDVNQSRTHNRANEICSVTSPSGVVQPKYDVVGNQTVDIAPGDWTKQYDLKWDAWNRLIEVKDGSIVLQTNAYDGLTRRITSKRDSNTIHYYYNEDWRAVEEYPDLNASTTPSRRYLWGIGNRWDLVKRQRDDAGSLDEERYVLYDAMDPVAICDEGGTIKQRFEYSPFGNTTLLNEAFTEYDGDDQGWSWLFHGEFRDDDTGYYNYGYRFYNDTTGRWVSRDPIEEQGGLNLYRFVANDPPSLMDTMGREPFDPVKSEKEDPLRKNPVEPPEVPKGKSSGRVHKKLRSKTNCLCQALGKFPGLVGLGRRGRDVLEDALDFVPEGCRRVVCNGIDIGNTRCKDDECEVIIILTKTAAGRPDFHAVGRKVGKGYGWHTSLLHKGNRLVTDITDLAKHIEEHFKQFKEREQTQRCFCCRCRGNSPYSN